MNASRAASRRRAERGPERRRQRPGGSPSSAAGRYLTIAVAKFRSARLPMAVAALAIALYVAGELFAPAGLAPDHYLGAAAAGLGRFAVHCGLAMAAS